MKQLENPCSRSSTEKIYPFGIVHCHGCELLWILENVPEYCPRCGAKVTDNPAPANALIIRGIKQNKLAVPISKCLFCHKEVMGTPKAHHDSCPHCMGELKLKYNGKRSFLKTLFASIFGT